MRQLDAGAQEALRVGMLRPMRIRSATVPSSTIRPAYITAILSATSTATPISCVTKITESPYSRCRSRMSRRIWICTVASSAVVGSSASSTFGLQASAIAIIARCSMPPDISCG